MSLWKEINEVPNSRRDLRKFGLTLGIFFGVVAGLMLWRGREMYVYFVGAAAFFLFFGLVLPVVLKPLHKVWMGLAMVMGWVMSRVILTVLFFAAITPIAVILRVLGKDILDLKHHTKKDSYWNTHKSRAKEDYENQF